MQTSQALNGFLWFRKRRKERGEKSPRAQRCCVKAPPSVRLGVQPAPWWAPAGGARRSSCAQRGRAGLHPPSQFARVPASLHTARDAPRTLTPTGLWGTAQRGSGPLWGNWSPVRASTRLAGLTRSASASRAVVCAPPSIPGRGASVHTRGFF